MGRPRRQYPTARCNLSFPVADERTQAWLQAQKCPSDSMRYLIQAYVRAYGITDPLMFFPNAFSEDGSAIQISAQAPVQAPVQTAVTAAPAPVERVSAPMPVVEAQVPVPAPAPDPIKPAPRPPEPVPVTQPSQEQDSAEDIVSRYFG